jgi:hypothetical protein
MKENNLLLTNVSLDDLADLIAQKLSLRVIDSRNEFETPPPSSSEDILFKSIKEAADYYGVCYQSLSNEVKKIDRLVIGNSIKIYKSALERAITVHGILPKKGGKK